jgi:aryl-alcohol dehydrogenase-like predicted oxidoreductase
MDSAVTCAIPGVRRTSQVEDNLAAAELEAPSPEILRKVRKLYEERIGPKVDQLW